MEKAIFDGTIKTVIVWKLDRISRRLKRRHQSALADWCERGVRVVSITQQIDLSGPVGRMVASVMFGLAEIELEYRRERQQAGIAVAKNRGVYRGRHKGTTKSKLARAGQLRKQGLTVPEIENALAVSERTVFRYLTWAMTDLVPLFHCAPFCPPPPEAWMRRGKPWAGKTRRSCPTCS